MAPPDTQIPRDAETVWVAYDGEVEIQEIGRYSSFGLNNLDLLLKSTALVRAFNFSDAVKTRFAGRHAMRLRAVPVESFDDFVQAVAGLVVLGADYYQVTIDADCGIVLAWEAYIDDQVASRQSVSDLLVDTPIDRAMFELPPGPYALPESLEYLN